MNRAEIQEKINQIKESNPDISQDELKTQIESWLGSFDLANQLFTQAQVVARIMDDLNSYEGVEA